MSPLSQTPRVAAASSPRSRSVARPSQRLISRGTRPITMTMAARPRNLPSRISVSLTGAEPRRLKVPSRNSPLSIRMLSRGTASSTSTAVKLKRLTESSRVIPTLRWATCRPEKPSRTRRKIQARMSWLAASRVQAWAERKLACHSRRAMTRIMPTPAPWPLAWRSPDHHPRTLHPETLRPGYRRRPAPGRCGPGSAP